MPELTEILGPDGIDLVVSEDKVQDRNTAGAFARKGLEKHSVAADPKNAGRMILTVGDDDYPTPIPIVQAQKGWRFDSKAGRQELLYRRIGGNELDAIQICRGFVEAQHAVRLEEARRRAREPVRAEDHLDPRQAGRTRVAQRGREMGRPDRGERRERDRRRATPTRRSRTTATSSRSSRARGRTRTWARWTSS